MGNKKIHWTKWSRLCKRKTDGGMGFHNFGAFNILAKQGWEVVYEPDSLMAKILKARYLQVHNIFTPKQGAFQATHREVSMTLCGYLKEGFTRQWDKSLTFTYGEIARFLLKIGIKFGPPEFARRRRISG